jgi:hypothetical protein
MKVDDWREVVLYTTRNNNRIRITFVCSTIAIG